MNDEIKEWLDSLYYQDDYCSISYDKLLDYITNLQQENEIRQQDINNLTYQLAKEKEENARLKEEYVLLQNASDEYEDELKERESELEERIQKAIDYLENAVPFRYFELRDILIYGEIRNVSNNDKDQI